MRIKIIFSSKNGSGWAGPGFESPANLPILILRPLSDLAHIYLSPTRPLSGPLNTPNCSMTHTKIRFTTRNTTNIKFKQTQCNHKPLEIHSI